jgi:hypothetical protein
MPNKKSSYNKAPSKAEVRRRRLLELFNQQPLMRKTPEEQKRHDTDEKIRTEHHNDPNYKLLAYHLYTIGELNASEIPGLCGTCVVHYPCDRDGEFCRCRHESDCPYLLARIAAGLFIIGPGNCEDGDNECRCSCNGSMEERRCNRRNCPCTDCHTKTPPASTTAATTEEKTS